MLFGMTAFCTLFRHSIEARRDDHSIAEMVGTTMLDILFIGTANTLKRPRLVKKYSRIDQDDHARVVMAQISQMKENVSLEPTYCYLIPPGLGTALKHVGTTMCKVQGNDQVFWSGLPRTGQDSMLFGTTCCTSMQELFWMTVKKNRADMLR